eukprot:scaffold5849_cov120-Skeletonema_dohrnii-CCMP3373.AAC.7
MQLSNKSTFTALTWTIKMSCSTVDAIADDFFCGGFSDDDGGRRLFVCLFSASFLQVEASSE